MVKPLTVISTFAGCGGSSLGYQMAGFKELLAVEWDDKAAETFRANFSDVRLYHGDIANLSVKECLKLSGIKSGELDVLDGSPPCQGFSTAGKRNFNDSRNQLFVEYARLLKGLQPKAFVVENVTGMIKGAMKQTFLDAIKLLRRCGYRTRGEVLNSMYFGVPQTRCRIIIIGIRNDLGIEPSHPKPQTQPITVREALKEIKPSEERQRVSPLQAKRWAQTRRGHAHHERFGLMRLSWNKPAPTILRTSGSGGHFHPDESRLLTISEHAALASFPHTFNFGDHWHNAVERIGNSVPPLLMKAVALHLKELLTSFPNKGKDAKKRKSSKKH